MGPDKFVMPEIEFGGIFTIAPLYEVEKVIFNKPATIVFWNDNTKTVVKCGEHDEWDPEKGLAMAISKKFLGDKFHRTFNAWCP